MARTAIVTMESAVEMTMAAVGMGVETETLGGLRDRKVGRNMVNESACIVTLVAPGDRGTENEQLLRYFKVGHPVLVFPQTMRIEVDEVEAKTRSIL
jgi:hypothetical protein